MSTSVIIHAAFELCVRLELRHFFFTRYLADSLSKVTHIHLDSIDMPFGDFFVKYINVGKIDSRQFMEGVTAVVKVLNTPLQLLL